MNKPHPIVFVLGAAALIVGLLAATPGIVLAQNPAPQPAEPAPQPAEPTPQPAAQPASPTPKPASEGAIPQAQLDYAAANPQDPFVRGLMRLDERLKAQREAEELARQEEEMRRRALELEKERAERAARIESGELVEGEELEEELVLAPLSDPDFYTAFATRKYRLEGLVLSKPSPQPVIHVLEEQEKPPTSILYWSGAERRWVYERAEDEKLSAVAAKFNMQAADLLAINGVAREKQLVDALRFYVSPRDNGPLTHIVVRGDTLDKLAKIYNTRVDRLRVRNRLDNKDQLVIGRRFLIREKAITADMSAMAVPAPMPVEPGINRDALARMAYARLGQYDNKDAAMRGAREFFDKYMEFMDSDIVLRIERDAQGSGKRMYNMDIGPMLSPTHGEAYCSLFRRDELPCMVVSRVPGDERPKNFDSQAIISVTPYVFYDGDDQLDSGRTNVDILTKQEYFLSEGQPFGNDQGMIAKITQDRIFVTDAAGFLITLPLAKLPEIDPIEKAKQEAAARQAAIDSAAAAAGAAAGAAQAPSAPSVEDTGVAQRLKDSETKRREGSGGFIKDLAKKPEKIEK